MHTISSNTALGKNLKEEVETRVKGYSNLNQSEALFKYAQDRKFEFAISVEDWDDFIEVKREKAQSTRASNRQQQQRKGVGG